MISKKIETALISVYHKEELGEVLQHLNRCGIKFISTGGTAEYIRSLGYDCTQVEDICDYPSLLGGRVKTLHPKIFGGILYRRDNEKDVKQIKSYAIPPIDLVMVDLYPFEETVASGADEEDIIEKIDIGGISLIRAAAKNYRDVLVIPSRNQYGELLKLLVGKLGYSDLEDRRYFAGKAFQVSSNYDSAISNYFDTDHSSLRIAIDDKKELRYGENSHQKAAFYGPFDQMLEQLHGKAISYNNLLDIDAALSLISDFSEPGVVIIKHHNACGAASRDTIAEAWNDALAGDPISAFGGVIVVNDLVDKSVAEEIDKIFFEVLIAPEYEHEALNILFRKKNRIILKLKQRGKLFSNIQYRSALNGILMQERDTYIHSVDNLEPMTSRFPTESEIEDLLFANTLVKHTKSNAIVLVKNKQLLGSGMGQSSRVDAVQHAIEKAKRFGFDLQGAVMASDAFFPFGDSVELAGKAGITAVIQPGGSIRDKESIDYCNEHNIAMVKTGIRHFKH